jgi:predicted hydrocarbon binding protein
MSKTPDPQVRLKGNPFARPDYFTTDVTKGATRTPGGTRVCTLTSDFLLGFRDALVYECGKSFRPVMKSCGVRWGKTFIGRFEKEITALYQTPVKDLPAGVVHSLLADAFNYHGWGKLTIDLSAADHGVLQIELTDSVMPGLVREADRPVDHLMTGLLAAIFGHFAGTQLDAVQTDCPTRGATASRFVITAPSRIAEIEEWLDAAPAESPITHEAVVRRLCQGSAVRDQESGVSAPAPADNTTTEPATT